MGLCASSNNTVKADAFSGSPVPSPVNETKEQKRGNKQGRGSSIKKNGGNAKRPQVLKKNTGVGGGGGAKMVSGLINEVREALYFSVVFNKGSRHRDLTQSTSSRVSGILKYLDGYSADGVP